MRLIHDKQYTDKQKASGDGDSPFTGGRAENASEEKFSAP
jgi:hypothetical protein